MPIVHLYNYAKKKNNNLFQYSLNVSIRNSKYKLKGKIARLVMETGQQNKHEKKRKLRKNIRSIKVLLSTSLSVIVYNALLHQINIAVKSRIKVIKLRHGK